MPVNLPDVKDREVVLWNNSVTRLSRFWENGPLVLVFLRHYGWPFCREQVAQLRRNEDEFQRLGAQVVLVGLGTPEQTADFKEQFQVPFPMVSDWEKRLFRDFDLKQMPPSSMLSVGLAVKGFMTLAKGHRMGIPKGDVMQLPGVFIIDTAGRIRYSHYARDPSDHPDPDSLLNVLRSDADLGAPTTDN